MSELKSLEDLYLVLGFVVPGLIVVFVRAQFLTGRTPPHSAALLNYLTLSIVYYALVLPLLDYVLSIEQPSYGKAIAWFGFVFVGPAIFGLVLGLNAQFGFLRRVLSRCGINPVHVMPTAWDWKFSNMEPQWVLVTLKDGTRFAGCCSKNSFMSSDPAERDMYIQWLYDIGEDNHWHSRGDNGVLVAAGEIKTIEFWPITPQGDHSEQERHTADVEQSREGVSTQTPH